MGRDNFDKKVERRASPSRRHHPHLCARKIECEKNPWHYDFELMRAVAVTTQGAAEVIEEYCRETIVGHDDGRRFHVNRQQVEELSRIAGLKP